MIIAREKKKSNIAEYIIYMWQIEDIIRGQNFDIEKIQQLVINNFDIPSETKTEMHEWYLGLIEMMETERIKEKGHLQVVQNYVIDLSDLHNQLLQTPSEAQYQAEYAKAFPNIQDFRKKLNNNAGNEIEICLTGLYALLLLRLQKKEIGKDTEQAIGTFGSLMAHLVDKYNEREKKEQDQQN